MVPLPPGEQQSRQAGASAVQPLIRIPSNLGSNANTGHGAGQRTGGGAAIVNPNTGEAVKRRANADRDMFVPGPAHEGNHQAVVPAGASGNQRAAMAVGLSGSTMDLTEMSRHKHGGGGRGVGGANANYARQRGDTSKEHAQAEPGLRAIKNMLKQNREIVSLKSCGTWEAFSFILSLGAIVLEKTNRSNRGDASGR